MTTIGYYDEDAIRDLLVGKSVAKVSDDELQLSDGTVLHLYGNDGGCSCGAGDYDLTVLNECDNIITDVQVEYPEAPEHWGKYTLFVFADNRQINLAEFEGSDDNGYYGTGFYIDVRA